MKVTIEKLEAIGFGNNTIQYFKEKYWHGEADHECFIEAILKKRDFIVAIRFITQSLDIERCIKLTLYSAHLASEAASRVASRAASERNKYLVLKTRETVSALSLCFKRVMETADATSRDETAHKARQAINEATVVAATAADDSVGYKARNDALIDICKFGVKLLDDTDEDRR